MDTTLETLNEAEDDLLGRSFLYEHPASYREGVEASMEAVRAMLAKVGRMVTTSMPNPSETATSLVGKGDLNRTGVLF